jgi:hypothetical protein
MKKDYLSSKMSKANDLNRQIAEHIKALAEATDQAKTGEQMQEYMDLCARFHQYSAMNVWSIKLTCPHATHVAGYHKWLELKRYVRKGEHGIPILAPLLGKDKDKEDEYRLYGFKVVYVFDVSQTDGEPLPEEPDWKSLEQNGELHERLMQFCKDHQIQVSIRDFEDETQGASAGGLIYLAPNAGTKTFAHEIAHELLVHRTSLLSREQRELEAESVAYVVARHFGLNELNCPNYLVFWQADSDKIMMHMERIRKCAAQIIEGVEQMKEVELEYA